MSGIRPRLSNQGPNTYPAGAPIKGGQVVEGRADGKAYPATAGSTTVLGVSEVDCKPWVDPVSVDADGFDTINIAPLPDICTPAFNRYVVTFAADCGFGKAIKAAANGTVTPWVSGTDAADLIIGYCDEPGGVVVASKSTGLANISR